ESAENFSRQVNWTDSSKGVGKSARDRRRITARHDNILDDRSEDWEISGSNRSRSIAHLVCLGDETQRETTVATAQTESRQRQGR
ncbi:hypothetical protein, partial [Streptococcus pyogenes]|uniref:hypothetical protein n=1 Tax=Streptococcus pyogenes TaxID=1314 RepID=UPI0016530325